MFYHRSKAAPSDTNLSNIAIAIREAYFQTPEKLVLGFSPKKPNTSFAAFFDAQVVSMPDKAYFQTNLH
jgi:hypothetical protein